MAAPGKFLSGFGFGEATKPTPTPAAPASSTSTVLNPNRDLSLEVEPWFTPPLPPPVLDKVMEQSETNYESRLTFLKSTLEAHAGTLANHNLTSIVVSGAADFAPSTVASTVIAPISFKDFDSFLSRTKSKSTSFFTNKRDSSTTSINTSGRRELSKKEPTIKVQQDKALVLQQCYTSIPGMYFSPEFHVYDNPILDTFIDNSFQLVRDNAEMNRPEEEADKAMQQLRLQTESSLSTNLNDVEICLFNETVTRADAIFQTIKNLQFLQQMVAVESERAVDLRKQILELKQTTTSGREVIIASQRKHDSAKVLLHVLANVSKTRESASAVDLLMKSSDYTGAFLLIEETLHVLDGELNGVFALRTMTRHFREYKETTGTAMSDRFIRDATSNLFPDSDQRKLTDRDLTGKLTPWVNGMLKRGSAKTSLHQYKVEMQRTLKSSGEIVLVGFFSRSHDKFPVNNELTAEAEKRFKLVADLDQSEFFNLMQHMFDALDLVLERADQVHRCLTEQVFEPMIASQQITSKEARDLTAYSKDCTIQIRKTSVDLYVKLVQVRAEYHKQKCTASQFQQVFELFTLHSPNHAGMQQVLNVQLETLMQFSHDKMTKRIVNEVDEKETWEALQHIPREVQQMVNTIEQLDVSFTNPTTAGLKEDLADEESKYLQVGGRKLKTLNCAGEMIHLVYEYLRMAKISSNTAWMCVGRMFDCLLVFDERLRRLILGTEVKTRNKLQVIGAKNLALTQQTVLAMHVLLPSIAKLACRFVIPVMQTRVKDELVKRIHGVFTDHETALKDTLCLLITMELNRLGKPGGLDQVEWDKGGTAGLNAAQEYMITFASKVDRLYAVLAANLDRQSVETVFQADKGIFATINTRIPELFEALAKPPHTPAGMMRVKVDVIYLVSALRKLKLLQGPGLGPGNTLETWVEQKYGKKY